MLDERMVLDNRFTPEIRAVVFVGCLDGGESGLDEVGSSSGLTLSLGVNVTDTSELEELLGHGRSNDTGSSRSRDKSQLDWSTLSCNLGGNSVSRSDLVTPISLSDGDKVELGHGDSTFNGTLHFLVAFPSQSDVVSLITDNGVTLESGSLTGLGLFLDGLDFHDFFLKTASQESINDFLFLDRDRESEDINDVVDELGLYQSAQLGDGFPLNLVLLSVRSSALVLFGSSSVSAETSAAFGLSISGSWFGCFLSHNLKWINIELK